MVRVFANRPEDQGSITGLVIPKTQTMVLDVSLLCTIRYKSRVKWTNIGKGLVTSPTPWCSSYRKENPLGHPRVTLDYGRQLYL